MAMSCIDTAEREAFQKLMSVHYFIILPPLDFIDYTHRQGLIPRHVYESVRKSAKYGLLMNRKHLFDDARALVCFTQVRSVGFKLNPINQLKYNNKLFHCIARVLCNDCKLPSRWNDTVHRDMMRGGVCAPR